MSSKPTNEQRTNKKIKFNQSKTNKITKMIFSDEEIALLPTLINTNLNADRDTDYLKRIISKQIPLLRLIANHVALEKSRILKDLQEKRQALVFKVEENFVFPSMTTVSFLDVMKEPEFIQRLSNVLYPKVFGIEISVSLGYIEIYLTLDLSKMIEGKDPVCVCEHRGFYDEGACCECGGYVVFCYECGAK